MSQSSPLDRDTWHHHIEQFLNCNQSKAQYCLDHGLAYHQFIYWHSQLSPAKTEMCESSPSTPASFVPLSLVPMASSVSVQLALPNGLRIEGITLESVGIVDALIPLL